MKTRTLRAIAGSLLALLLNYYSAHAQQYYEWRLGAGVGVMNYYGDVSYKFNSTKFSFPAYYLSIGKNISPSFGLHLQASYGQITANDRTSDFKGNLQTANANFGRALNFQTDIRSANLIFNYRFDNGRILSAYAPIAPYLFAGIGVTDFTVYGDLYGANGSRYYYWSDNTIRNQSEKDPNPGASTIISQDGDFETELSKLDVEKSYPTTVLSIPFGLGVQFRLSERLSANIQLGATYAFTDYLDDVSGVYRDDYPSEVAFYAANPSGVNRTVRGEGKDNNDLYFSSFVTLNYHFGYRRKAFNAPLVYTGYNQAGSAVKTDVPPLPKPARATSSSDSLVTRKTPNATTNRNDSLITSKKPAPLPLPIAQEPDTTLTQAPTTSSYTSNLAGRDKELIKLRSDSIREATLRTNRSPYQTSNSFVQQPSANQYQGTQGGTTEMDTTITLKEEQVRSALARKQTQGKNRQRTTITEDDRGTNGLTEEEQQAIREAASNGRIYVVPQGGTIASRRDTTIIIGQTVTGQSEGKDDDERTDTEQLKTDLTALRAELTQLRSQKTVVRDPAMNQTLDSLLTLVSTLESSAAKTVIGPLPDSMALAPNASPVSNQDSIRLVTARNDSLILSLKDQVQSLSQSLGAIRSGLSTTKEPVARKSVAGYSRLIVYYGVNKSSLTDSDKQRLTILADKLKSDPAVKLNVKGYTDQTGNPEYNLMLSKKRAENIVRYLTSEKGVNMNQILVNYYGPADASAAQKSNPIQRKVELELFVGE